MSGSDIPAHIVLVVEDEALVRLSTVDTLADAGFTVLEAGNVDEALALLSAREDIGVVFSDINMPGDLDGIDLARIVNARRPDVHMILTSGKVRPRVEDLPPPGAFISKPYSVSAITRMVKVAMDACDAAA